MRVDAAGAPALTRLMNARSGFGYAGALTILVLIAGCSMHKSEPVYAEIPGPSFAPASGVPVETVPATASPSVSAAGGQPTAEESKAIGVALILIALLGLFFWWRGTLFNKKWLLWIMVLSVLLPQAANQLGWMSAEVGRQPWIVYHLLRTAEAVSVSVETGQIVFSLILFGLIYLLLFLLFIFLLDRKIKHGPEEPDTLETPYSEQRTILG